jgi:hypothetical protein
MKARIFAALFVAACSAPPAMNPSAVSEHTARGQYLVDQNTPAETASHGDALDRTTPKTTVAHATAAVTSDRAASRSDVDVSPVQLTSEHVAPEMAPVFSPRPINTGDPCGWCR